MATGCLSTARVPDLPGLASFAGKVYHTGAWPHEKVDFTGQRVGVIGTGSSAIQAIPVIASEAKQLTVFQRTANFSVPARNGPLAPGAQQAWKADYDAHRRRAAEIRNAILTRPNDTPTFAVSEEERQRIFEERWQAGGIPFMASFNDLILDRAANETAAEFVRAKIRAIVKDPATADLLTPRGHPIGAKRLCVDTDYYETFNRDQCDAWSTCAARRSRRSRRKAWTRPLPSYALDAIVFATGFDAMTGALLGMDIPGRGGLTLRADLGGRAAQLSGPDGGGLPQPVHDHRPRQPLGAEQHAGLDRAACRAGSRDCLAHLRAHGIGTIEATAEAEDAWVEHVSEVGERTLYPQANSWYVGANIPGKPRDLHALYRRRAGLPPHAAIAIAANGYEGFALQPAQDAVAAE